MNSLIELSSQFKAVGFDLDGTLYDEFDFIVQFYHSLSEKLGDQLRIGCYEHACKIWLEHGSSYPFIFQNMYEKYYFGNLQLEHFVEYCLMSYRQFKPALQLSKRAKFILETLSESKNLFLVSDGTAELQKQKFDSLGLSSFFTESSQFYTGTLGSTHYKPSPRILQGSSIEKSSKVIFFGDRDVDQSFAENCGFTFYFVKNMELFGAH